MTAFDPKFDVWVSDNDIVITLSGTNYSVTYFKRKGFTRAIRKGYGSRG
jgi:hypothetical protein